MSTEIISFRHTTSTTQKWDKKDEKDWYDLNQSASGSYTDVYKDTMVSNLKLKTPTVGRRFWTGNHTFIGVPKEYPILIFVVVRYMPKVGEDGGLSYSMTKRPSTDQSVPWSIICLGNGGEVIEAPSTTAVVSQAAGRSTTS